MKIEAANKTLSNDLAMLHRREIETGFLSKLGDAFLELLYRSMIESDGTICLAALDQGELAGFICGCENTAHFYKNFLRHHFFSTVIRAVPALFRRGTVKGLYESLHYAGSLSTYPAELVSMVVRDRWRGSGLAPDLLKELAIEFERRGVSDFTVVAGSELATANAFYRKMGLRAAGTIEVHAGVVSHVYEAHVSDLIEPSQNPTMKKNDVRESR